jgi:hypothetical protein
VGIGPTLFGYLVHCEVIQSARLVAMESLLVASVETFTQMEKNRYAAIMDFSKICKSKIIALDGVKTPTKF